LPLAHAASMFTVADPPGRPAQSMLKERASPEATALTSRPRTESKPMHHSRPVGPDRCDGGQESRDTGEGPPAPELAPAAAIALSTTTCWAATSPCWLRSRTRVGALPYFFSKAATVEPPPAGGFLSASRCATRYGGGFSPRASRALICWSNWTAMASRWMSCTSGAEGTPAMSSDGPSSCASASPAFLAAARMACSCARSWASPSPSAPALAASSS
jgi:hypothetical protein